MLSLAQQVGERLIQQGLLLVTAESCTGGWLGQAVTTVAGSSVWYERGYITYSNISKCEMLSVRKITLKQHGAVSEKTAQEMAAGAIKGSRAQIGVSITGIAGPDGGTEVKPVGMICFAWAVKEGLARSETRYFKGDRSAIRYQSVVTALQGILDILHDIPPVVV